MEDRDHFPDFMEVVGSITDAEIVSSGSQHSIVVKITLATGEVCALKIVFIYDGEKEENKDLRPKLLGEDRGKTTTSSDEFYDECGTQTMIYERSLYAKITPELQGYKVLTQEEANTLISKLRTTTLPTNYSEYLQSWVQNEYKLAVIKMELLGPEFRPLDKIILAEIAGAEERLSPYLPKMFAIILFMAFNCDKIMLDPNLGNFMAISGDPSRILIIDLAETIPLPDYLKNPIVTGKNAQTYIKSINREAYGVLVGNSAYPYKYGPYESYIDVAFSKDDATNEAVKQQIAVELNKLTNPNIPIISNIKVDREMSGEASGPTTKVKKISLAGYRSPQDGPIYGGSKRARRKLHTARVKCRATRRKNRRAIRRRTQRKRR